MNTAKVVVQLVSLVLGIATRRRLGAITVCLYYLLNIICGGYKVNSQVVYSSTLAVQCMGLSLLQQLLSSGAELFRGIFNALIALRVMFVRYVM